MKSHITDPAMFGLWLDSHKQLSESTRTMYISSLISFLKKNPEIDKLDTYNEFIIKTCIKKRSTHFYTVLHDYITFKIEDASLRRVLLDGLIRPDIKMDIFRERKYISEEKIIDVINNLADIKHRTIALIQSMTGVRAGDIMRLKKGLIMPEEYEGKPVLKLSLTGKRKKRNVVFIHDEVAQSLIMYYITEVLPSRSTFDEYYFIDFGSRNKRRGDITNHFKMYKMNYNWYWGDLKQALENSGVDKDMFATHDFRRCFARRAWERYKDIHVLQSLLSHQDPKTTLRYLTQSGLRNIDYHKDMQTQ